MYLFEQEYTTDQEPHAEYHQADLEIYLFLEVVSKAGTHLQPIKRYMKTIRGNQLRRAYIATRIGMHLYRIRRWHRQSTVSADIQGRACHVIEDK